MSRSRWVALIAVTALATVGCDRATVRAELTDRFGGPIRDAEITVMLGSTMSTQRLRHEVDKATTDAAGRATMYLDWPWETDSLWITVTASDTEWRYATGEVILPLPPTRAHPVGLPGESVPDNAPTLTVSIR